jgi:phosphomannomutase
MTNIKFGTDGWRAIIAKEYTVDNVIRVSEAAAKWMLDTSYTQVVIGYDTRFGGKMFSEYAAAVFGHFGLKVFLAPEFVSTPMVSLGVIKTASHLGVVITASHNPPEYNGYKLKSRFGGPSIPKDIAEVEDRIPEEPLREIPTLDDLRDKGLLESIDLEAMYLKHIRDHFNLDMIYASGLMMAYDAMYGAGQNIMLTLFPQAFLFNCDYNPSFMGTAPEPIDRNLRELSDFVQSDPTVDFGLANDGDADRIGICDSDGKFVDSHRLLLLLLRYLVEHKGMTGKVVMSFSVTDKLKKLAQHYGLEVIVTPIGFKHIAEIMTVEDVLIGGEESGGIAVKGHIPERDGIWTGFLLMEYLAITKKSFKDLLSEVYNLFGEFDFYRDDLHLEEAQKIRIVEALEKGKINKIGSYDIVGIDDLDGFKLNFGSEKWTLIRASGTEPVLRVYAQARDMKEVRKILDETKATLLKL